MRSIVRKHHQLRKSKRIRLEMSPADKQIRDNMLRLTRAIRCEDAGAIARLLKRGAIADLRVSTIALCYAVSLRNLAAIRLLLEHDAYVDDDCLRGVPCEVAQVFYEHVNVRYSSSSAAVLHRAVKCNDVEGASILLNRGATANGRASVVLSTPLHVAVEFASVQCVSLLLQHDANPNLTDTLSSTPLDIALRFNYANEKEEKWCDKEQIIEMLLDAGANINCSLYKWLMCMLFQYGRIRSSHMKLANLLLKHIAKMEPKGLYVHSKILQIIEEHKCLKRFYTQCREEISKMQQIKIFGKISLYDFMVKSTRTMTAYTNCDHLLISEEECQRNFPIFHANLEIRLLAAYERKKLIRSASTGLCMAMRYSVNPEHIAAQKILRHLGTEDLKNLMVVKELVDSDEMK